MKVVCPGSFDPVTLGHVDIIARAALIYESVTVTVVHNPEKQGLFTPQERYELIRASLTEDSRTAECTTIDVDIFSDGLLVDYCADIGAGAVVKGLRSETDFAYELPMALMNRRLSGVETLFLPGDPRFGHISSSLIRQVHSLGGDISGQVPEAVLTALRARAS